VELRQEHICKVYQLIDADIILICPEERQGLQDVLLMPKLVVFIDIGTILRHRGITDNEQLNKPKQTTERSVHIGIYETCEF
jgi:hypothetical protein